MVIGVVKLSNAEVNPCFQHDGWVQLNGQFGCMFARYQFNPLSTEPGTFHDCSKYFPSSLNQSASNAFAFNAYYYEHYTRVGKKVKPKSRERPKLSERGGHWRERCHVKSSQLRGRWGESDKDREEEEKKKRRRRRRRRRNITALIAPYKNWFQTAVVEHGQLFGHYGVYKWEDVGRVCGLGRRWVTNCLRPSVGVRHVDYVEVLHHCRLVFRRLDSERKKPES